MKSTLLIAIILLCSVSASAVTHPVLWLDSTTLTRLTSLKTGNDATWTALKADADAFAADTVEAYSVSSCTGNDICYTYEGLGWLAPVEELALAYKMTGSTTYSNQVKAILNAEATATQATVTSGNSPCSVDSGFPARSAILALAIGYDWIYDQLSSTDKTNYTTALDACWTWTQAHAFEWPGSAGGFDTGYSNYFGGHLVGYCLAALAVEGDDTNASSMQTTCLNNFNNDVKPMFDSTQFGTACCGSTYGAGFSGGYAIEGYSYGPNNFIRLFQYMRGMTTAGKTDLFNNNISWLKTVSKNYIYQLRPDLLRPTDEGDFAGSYLVIFRSLPYDLSGWLVGTTEGGWMQQAYNNIVSAGVPDSISLGIVAPSNFELFLYNQGTSAVDYTATQPTTYWSSGDEHSYARSDWTSSAIWSSFLGFTAFQYAGHATRAAGHVAIQRGSDYLLVNGAQWKDGDGIVGSPETDDEASAQTNTLYYYDGQDGGTGCFNPATHGSQYWGCQMFWTTPPQAVKHLETANYSFSEADLKNTYFNNGFVTTITMFKRNWINEGGINFVFDRISSPTNSTRQLNWHTPALNTASPAGNATAISVSSPLATVTVGASKLWIEALLPASATMTQNQGLVGYGGAAASTQYFAVTDPNASMCSTNCQFLTVLAPTASGASAPSFTLINVTGYKGALYNDAANPKVALFSNDGTSQTSVTYTASYAGGLTGRHVILDLIPGSYTVIRDSVTILNSQTVGSDGSLTFTATGGTTWTVQAGNGAAAVPGRQPRL